MSDTAEVRNWIAGLSDRGELILMNLVCFGWFVLATLISITSRHSVVQLNTARALAGIATEILLGTLAAQILRIRGWSLTRLGIEPSWRQTFAGVALCFITFISLGVVFVPLSRLAVVQAMLTSGPAFRVTAPSILFLPTAFTTGVYEEIFVVAYNVRATARNGAAFAISFSTVVRVLYHLYQGPAVLLTIGMMGVIFAAVYWRWRTVWPLIVAHTVWDLFAFARYHG